MTAQDGSGGGLSMLLRAAAFAAHKHCDQRRKGEGGRPYINHPLEVARLLAEAAEVEDPALLAAALLHDTIEDTDATREEIEAAFGAEVLGLVLEVTDDRSLPRARRKELQIEHAPHLSPRAKLLKLADKIQNVRSIADDPPPDWPRERRLGYLVWAERVVQGLRGCHPGLESLFDDAVSDGHSTLASSRRA